MTQRERIIAAVFAKCDALTGCVAYRSREAALARSEGPAVLVHPEEESVELRGLGVVVRDFAVVCSIITRGAVPDKAADTVAEALHAALAADQTLGGLVARTIETGSKWNFEIADQNAVALEARYSFRYLTPAATLSSLA